MRPTLRATIAPVRGLWRRSDMFRVWSAGFLLCILSLQSLSWRIAWRFQKTHAERLARRGHTQGLIPMRMSANDLKAALIEKNELALNGVWFDIMRRELCGPDTLLLWLWRDEIETALRTVWQKSTPAAPADTPAALALRLWLNAVYLLVESLPDLARGAESPKRSSPPAPPEGQAQCAPSPLSPPPKRPTLFTRIALWVSFGR